MSERTYKVWRSNDQTLEIDAESVTMEGNSAVFTGPGGNLRAVVNDVAVVCDATALKDASDDE